MPVPIFLIARVVITRQMFASYQALLGCAEGSSYTKEDSLGGWSFLLALHTTYKVDQQGHSMCASFCFNSNTFLTLLLTHIALRICNLLHLIDV